MPEHIPFTARSAPDSSESIKFLANGAELNSQAAANHTRIRHDGKWLWRNPSDDDAKFATKPIADLGPSDATWVRHDSCRDRAPTMCSVPLKQHLLGVWRRGKDTTLVLSIPDDVRPLVLVTETGGGIAYARFYQQHNQFNSSCYSTYTEYNFPGGLDKSEDTWDNHLKRLVKTDNPLELLWWRDEEAKATLTADMQRYKERWDAYIAAICASKQAAQGAGIKLVLGGEACCAALSCEPCIVPLCRACDCVPYQHHWFFKWHGVEVTADPSATAAPTDAARVGTTTCKWNWAQCCCPLWPLLPCICMCVSARD